MGELPYPGLLAKDELSLDGLKKVLEKGFSLPRCLVRERWCEEGFVYWELRDQAEGRLRKWIISFYERSVRRTWRGLLDLGSRRICKECSADGHLSLYVGSVLMSGRGLFTRDFCV